MKTITATCAVLALAAGIGFALAQDKMPEMPKPGPEHALLKQFVGQWDCDVEMCMDPDPKKPAVKSKATETTTMLGEFWLLIDVKGDFMGAPFNGHGQMTYDVEKKKYFMTWIDSMGPTFVTSTGTADATGKTWTMECEMVCEGVKTQMRDVFTVTGPDTRTMVSNHKNGDAPWREAMRISYKRKK